MIRYLAYLLPILLMQFSFAGTKIYETIDKQGNRVYTDQKPMHSDDIKEINIPSPAVDSDKEYKKELQKIDAEDKKLTTEFDREFKEKQQLRENDKVAYSAYQGALDELKKAQAELQSAKEDQPEPMVLGQDGKMIRNPLFYAHVERMTVLEQAVVNAQARVSELKNEMLKTRSQLNSYDSEGDN